MLNNYHNNSHATIQSIKMGGLILRLGFVYEKELYVVGRKKEYHCWW